MPIPFAKKKSHTQSSIKDKIILPLPFAKKKIPHPILNKRQNYYATSICQKKYTQLSI
jgi:hypothetical protein